MKAAQTKHTAIKRKLSTRPPIEVEKISERAYLMWLERGCTHGFDTEDWLKAEYELQDREVLMKDEPAEP